MGNAGAIFRLIEITTLWHRNMSRRWGRLSTCAETLFQTFNINALKLC